MAKDEKARTAPRSNPHLLIAMAWNRMPLKDKARFVWFLLLDKQVPVWHAKKEERHTPSKVHTAV